MNVVFLPMWANAAFIVAIIVLIALALSNKINFESVNLPSTKKSAYYITATIAVVGLAAFFLILSPLQASGAYLGAIGGMLFLAFLVATLGGMEASNKKMLLSTTGGVTVVCVVFTTLCFANAGFAAIWLAVLLALGFIGYLLFPATK